MGLFGKKKTMYNAKLSELTDKERERAIRDLEHERDDVTYRIEELMKRIAKAGKGKMKRLARRRYKLGKAPNDKRP